MGIASTMNSDVLERVIAFPLAGQTRLIRHCASALENLHGEDALRYWKAECRTLAVRLKILDVRTMISGIRSWRSRTRYRSK